MTPNVQPKIIDILLVEDSPADVLIAREALAEAKLFNTIHVAEDGVVKPWIFSTNGESSPLCHAQT
jgi:hypothetical protein